MAASILMVDHELEDLEIDLLLEGVFRRFGHDFRGYKRANLRKRLRRVMQAEGLSTVSALQDRVMHQPGVGDALLRALIEQPTSLFDQPEHFQALRRVIGPWLRSRPAPKVWIADCMSAEQACSIAILLEEEQVYERTQIFATVANASLLEQASSGRLAPERMAEYEGNYRRSGGKAALAEYLTEEQGRPAFRPRLRRNITWAQYNLATDASFNEFELILCRRSLTDFDALLRRRSLQLFHDSLALFGLISADGAEEMHSAPFETHYKPVCEQQGLFRRVM